LVKAQEEKSVSLIETPIVSFGLNGGMLSNMNSYKEDLDDHGNDFYAIDGGKTIGLDVAVKLTQKTRLRVGLRYADMKYGMNWSESNNGSFYKTEVKVYNMDFNLNYDYFLFQTKRFELLLSPGLLTEYVADADYKNYKNDGSTSYNKYYGTQHPKSIAGLNFSAIGRIPLTKRIGLTLTPGYTYFLRKYVLDNDGAYQRFTFDFGVDFRLF
jgi:hypothetical protein